MIIEKVVNIFKKDDFAKRFSIIDTEFDVQRGKISAVISETEYKQLCDGKVTLYEKTARAEMTASKINWLVKSGKSDTDFTLTDRTAELITEKLEIKNKDGSATIISGGKMNLDEIFAQDITASGTVTGLTLKSTSIESGSINVGNGNFTVSETGKMVAKEGEIGGITLLSDGLYSGGYLLGDRGMVYKCGMSSAYEKHAFWAGEENWYVNANGFMHAENVDISGKYQNIKDDAKVTIYDGKFQVYERVPVEDMDTGESLGYEWSRKIYIGINSKNNASINAYGDVGELCAAMNKNGFNMYDGLENVCVSVNKKGFHGKVTTYDGDYKYAVGSSDVNIWRTKVIRTVTSEDNIKKLIIWGGYGAEGSNDTSEEKEEESHYFLDQQAVIALILDACSTLEKKMQQQIDALKVK